MNYIVLAIPVFLGLVAVEALVARFARKDVYRLDDSVADLSCGILQQLLEALFKTTLFAGYGFVYDKARFVDLPSSSPAVWLFAFLGVDFLYYWFHRLSHEVGFLWAAHVVHHQSEEYNLSVALRQGALQPTFSWIFYLPLALLGVPPAVFLTAAALNTLYQFWIHTRLIGKLGPLESVLSTPSNHRVHHGRNPQYIDRNHGGTLIVWDRLFGTYAPEDEEPVYGITTPLASWNPLRANVATWAELMRKARSAPRFLDKLRFFLKPPGWQPEEMGGFVAPPRVDPRTYVKFGSRVSAGVRLYVALQFLLVLLGTCLFLFRQDQFSPATKAALAGGIAVALGIFGALLEARSWALGLELARLAVLTGIAVWAALRTPYGAGLFALAAVTLALGLWLWRRHDPLGSLSA